MPETCVLADMTWNLTSPGSSNIVIDDEGKETVDGENNPFSSLFSSSSLPWLLSISSIKIMK